MPLAAPVIAAIIGGGASIAGGVLANKGSQTSSNTPTVAPAYQGLQDQVLQLVKGRLSSDPNLTGYQGTGVSTINKSYDLAKQSEDNNLTARGLATSPIAANVDATRDSARVGDVTSFQNSIPLLANQIQQQNIGQAAGILSGGRGSTSTGTVANGGGAAGGFTNLAQYLGYLTGKGAFKGGQGGGLYPTGGNGMSYAPSPDAGEGY